MFRGAVPTIPSLERFAIAAVAGSIAVSVGYVGLRGLQVPSPLATALIVMLGAAGAAWLMWQLPRTLDGLLGRKPWWCAAWLLLGLVAVGQTIRLSAFMLDPARSQHSLFPGDPWYVEHCCLTAYTESARLASQGEANIFKPELYRDRKLESFNVDLYHYPPSFLLLPRAALAVTGGDFHSVRKLWFSASALTLMLAMGLLAWRLEPQTRLRAIGAAPAIWISFPAQLGLQMSNFQILVVAIAVLAFVAFPRRAALGGALLGLSIVSKIFPGILALYLVARRRWREAAWSAAFGAALCLLALAVLGPTPFRAFLDYELPRLSSGEAFARPFSRPFAVAQNMAPFGIPLKLGLLGVPGMTLALGRIISLIYSLVVAGLAIWAARRPPRSVAEAASVWLALLSLATLVSPFAPANYVLFSLVWLVCIDRENFRPLIAAVIWLLTSAPFLFPREGELVPRMVAYLPAQVFAVMVPAIVLWQAGRKP